MAQVGESERASTHMHTGTAVYVHVRACALVQWEGSEVGEGASGQDVMMWI